MPIRSQNPATGEILEEFKPLSNAGIEAAIDQCASVFADHAGLPFARRAECMNSAAGILEAEKRDFGRMMVEEMGKPIAAAVAEAEKCAWLCRYYAENAERFLADEEIDSDASRSFVRHLPVGPVLAVMPWNFPFWQVFRFAAPALMAGNTALLKHASNVPRCALAIEDIFKRAGFMEGVFRTLLIGSKAVDRVLKDERVRAATVTGSEGAGSAVAETAGQMIKKTVLELGGSDAFIVMPSANRDAAIDAAVKARNINNGQSCIAAKRFIVHEELYDAFRDAMVQKFEALRVGDPMNDATDIGPLALEDIREGVDKQVRQSVKAGARRLTGAEKIKGKGWFYRPGVLEDIPENAPAYTEEVFGPVALLFRVSSLDEAVGVANATSLGLGSAIWTADKSEMERAANEIEAGATFVNSIVASDPRLPFGGVRNSGYGRELSRLGIREFVNHKTISIA